jgi:hypothetical protein
MSHKPNSRLPLQHLASQLQLIIRHLDDLLNHSLVQLLLHLFDIILGCRDDLCSLVQKSLGGLSVDGFGGELGDDGEGGFVGLEQVRKRVGVNGETGDSRRSSVGSARGVNKVIQTLAHCLETCIDHNGNTYCRAEKRTRVDRNMMN